MNFKGFGAAHRSHCCQKHGCKYSYTDENCPVKLYGGQEQICNWCHAELYDEGGWEDAHLLNEMYNKGRKNAWAEVVKLSKGDWELKA